MGEIVRQPLYTQVYDVLARRIISGEWSKGAIIPNEYQLSTDLAVSIGTLRKAVDLLVRDRLLDRRQGRGTFVLDRLSNEMRHMYDGFRHRDGSLIDWHFVRHDVDYGTATDEERTLLGLNGSAPVTRIARLHAIGRRPAVYSDIVLPSNRFPDVENLSTEATSIVLLASRAGIQLGPADERVDVRPVTESAANALNVALGTPILRLRRVVRDVTGVPLESLTAQCHLVDEYYRSTVITSAR